MLEGICEKLQPKIVGCMHAFHTTLQHIFFFKKARKCRLIATLHTKRRFLQLTQSRHPIKIYLYVTDSGYHFKASDIENIIQPSMWPTWPKKLTPAGYCVPQPHKLFFRFIHASTHMCKFTELVRHCHVLPWLSNTKSISIFKFWKSAWSNCNPSPNPCQDKQNKFTDIKYFNLQMPGKSSTF